MKFTAKEDIDAPIDAVFRMVSDFDTFERSAMRRGAEVQRVDQLSRKAVGMEWEATFQMRGKRRQMRLRLGEYEPDTRVGAELRSPGFTGVFVVDLLSLSRTRTRMSVELDVKPLTLPARLLVQSLRLAKSNLTKRFKLRVAEYSKDMEERHGRTA